MLFHSFSFAIFFPIVFALYWMLPQPKRWILLLVSSYYFYMSWNARYVFLILLTTAVSYLAAICIERAQKKWHKRMCIGAAALICFGILFLYKYFNFVMDSISAVAGAFALSLHPVTLNLLLPVGISFYTFQTISYVVDVYRGEVRAERHFGKYAVFVSFFPQLVAGPIERTRNLLPQIHQNHSFSYEKAAFGLKLMAWGYFKKIVIASTLAPYVDLVFENLKAYSGFSLVAAAVFFSFQIYCDFSGYSDIAIGAAKLLGIDLMQNFRSPYFSASIREFWSRWHISLSTWFRDYVYIPLGGNRCGKIRHKANLLITFMLSGLWHGANWTFVIWGALHGGAQIIETCLNRTKAKPAKGIRYWVGVIFVFAFSTITWVFFRATDLNSVGYVFTHAFDHIVQPVQYVIQGLHSLSIYTNEGVKISLMLILLLVFDFCNLKCDVISRISSLNTCLRWIIYVLFILFFLYLLPVSSSGEFIYFQF